MGADPTPIVEPRTYQDGTPVQSSISNYPPVVVTIHEWQNISQTDRILIISDLTIQGFIEQQQREIKDTDPLPQDIPIINETNFLSSN